MEVDSNMLFSIAATINNGWCGDTTRKGDYFNDVAHSFERVAGKTDIRKDVAVIQYGKSEDEGKASLEEAHQRCSYEKVFWQYAKDVQENTHAEVWFQ